MYLLGCMEKITWKKIIVDTNVLLTSLIEKKKFESGEWKKCHEHLKSLSKDNDFYITDIIEYEYKKNLLEYQKGKKGKKELTIKQQHVLNIYYDNNRLLKTPYETLWENLLTFDKKIEFEDIKYQDKLILMTWHLHFWNDYLILTADRSDFIWKVPEKLIKEIRYFTILDKWYRPRTYYLVAYNF